MLRLNLHLNLARNLKESSIYRFLRMKEFKND